MLTVVPDWVRPPHREVRAAEDVTLRQFGSTKAPASLGAHHALAWLGQAPGEPTPVAGLTREPTEAAARTEMEVASHIMSGDPYPDHPLWWEKRGIPYFEIMDAGLWARWVGNGYDQDFALGVMKAFCWLVGVFDRPTCMVPPRYGDGSHIPAQRRQLLAARLFRLDYPEDEVRKMLAAPGVDLSNLSAL